MKKILWFYGIVICIVLQSNFNSVGAMALNDCPLERRCGENCCGENHVCMEGQKCCLKYLYEKGNPAMCCDAKDSPGYARLDGVCCEKTETVYTYGFGESEKGYSPMTACCPSSQKLTNLGKVSACCSTEEIGYISEQYFDNAGSADDGYIITDCCAGVVFTKSDDKYHRSQGCCPYNRQVVQMDDIAECCDKNSTPSCRLKDANDKCIKISCS